MRGRVWDTDIDRLFGSYETEAEALSLVRGLIAANGDAYATDLAVGCERPDGRFAGPWSGAELLARVEAALAQPREPARSQ